MTPRCASSLADLLQQMQELLPLVAWTLQVCAALTRWERLLVLMSGFCVVPAVNRQYCRRPASVRSVRCHCWAVALSLRESQSSGASAVVGQATVWMFRWMRSPVFGISED